MRVLILLAVLVMTGSGWGAKYYVAPTDSAHTWAQSLNSSTPCSWMRAMVNAVAGDTVLFKNGTYYMQRGYWSHTKMTPINSGETENPILIKGDTEVFISTGINVPDSNATFGAYGVGYIIWDGFHVAKQDGATSTSSVMLMKAHHITIRNMDFTGYDDPAGNDNAPCIFMEACNTVIIENCKFHDSKSTDNHAAAIIMYLDTGTIVRNCEIYNCTRGIWDKSTSIHSRFYKNFFYNNEDASILIETYNTGGPNATEEQAYQNIIIASLDNSIVLPCNTSFKSNMSFYNNTIIGGRITVSECGSSTTGTQIYNNIQTAGTSPSYDTSNTSFADYNDYSAMSSAQLTAWRDSTYFDSNSINTNPLFVNASGTRPEDFKLQAGSLCLGTGRDGLNMGAYLSNNDIIGVYPTSKKKVTVRGGLK
jgi:hypothetical protein